MPDYKKEIERRRKRAITRDRRYAEQQRSQQQPSSQQRRTAQPRQPRQSGEEPTIRIPPANRGGRP